MRMDVRTFNIDQLSTGMHQWPSETSAGHDGILYSLTSGSPRYGIQRSDASSLENIGGQMELRDDRDLRVDGRGVTATTSGDIFVADWSGQIHEFSPDGTFRRRFSTGLNDQLDINLRSDGLLAVGDRFGRFAITDTSFSTVANINVGSSQTYVGFVTPPPGPAVPEPSTYAMAVMGALGLGLFAWRRHPRRAATD